MMSFVHYMCCTCKGTYCSFDEGYAYMQQELKAEHLKHLFQVIKSGATFEEVLEIAGQLCAIFDICSFIEIFYSSKLNDIVAELLQKKKPRGYAAPKKGEDKY